jgi:hypothetical protein
MWRGRDRGSGGGGAFVGGFDAYEVQVLTSP